MIAEGAQLERGCWIAPNSYVPAGRRIPENTMWAGNPVRFVKELKPYEERTIEEKNTEDSVKLMEN